MSFYDDDSFNQINGINILSNDFNSENKGSLNINDNEKLSNSKTLQSRVIKMKNKSMKPRSNQLNKTYKSLK